MKHFISLFLVLGTVMGLCTGCGGAAPARDPTETTVNAAKEILDSKNILFVGNSYTYVGRVVYQVINAKPELEDRQNDKGMFYRICQKKALTYL